jgi:hypothetical protein
LNCQFVQIEAQRSRRHHDRQPLLLPLCFCFQQTNITEQTARHKRPASRRELWTQQVTSSESTEGLFVFRPYPIGSLLSEFQLSHLPHSPSHLSSLSATADHTIALTTTVCSTQTRESVHTPRSIVQKFPISSRRTAEVPNCQHDVSTPPHRDRCKLPRARTARCPACTPISTHTKQLPGLEDVCSPCASWLGCKPSVSCADPSTGS